MTALTIGRFVHYTLSEHDAAEINKRREENPTDGNRVQAGQDYPAVVVVAWNDKAANLQVLLDGEDSYWATSRCEGTEQGYWHWPARA